MRAAKLTVFGILVVVLAGCDLVTSKHPVGEPLSAEGYTWEGNWSHPDGVLTVRVADAERGVLEAAWVEEKKGEFVLETVGVELREFGDWTFANFSGVDAEEPNLLWSRLGRNEEELFLWWPRHEEFQRLVEEGLLPGKVEDGDVVLDRLESEHLALIVSEEHGVLFEWDEPMTFRRLR